MKIAVIVTPDFNMAATMSFVDPFRAANYIDRTAHFRWNLISVEGGLCGASNGLSIQTEALSAHKYLNPELVLVSASWGPENYSTPTLLSKLREWARRGSLTGALDTGAFILAAAGLLDEKTATVHYEHIDSFRELFPTVEISESMIVFDGKVFSCCGGNASSELGLHLIRQTHGDALANSAAKYIFNQQLRPIGALQDPGQQEPLGHLVPEPVRKAVMEMEANLEDTLSIPQICRSVGVSQRHLNRLFGIHVGKSMAVYYRDIRLDRAQSLVTQTNLPLSQISVASGFSSQVYFSRAYKERFGLSPSSDRIEGRIPFEYRASPIFRKQSPVSG